MSQNDPVLYEFRLSDLIFACRELVEQWFDDEDQQERADDILDELRERYAAFGHHFATDVRNAFETVGLHNPDFWDPATESVFEIICDRLEAEEEDEEDE